MERGLGLGVYAHCYPPWTEAVGGLFNGHSVNSLVLNS